MNMMQLKAVALAIALGAATAATAQTGGTSGSSSGATPGAATSGSTTGNRVPANRADDPTMICQNVPTKDRDACMARENARRSGNGSTAGSTSGTFPLKTISGERDHLCRQNRDRLFCPKNHGVTRRDIFGPEIFDDAKEVASQEHAAI